MTTTTKTLTPPVTSGQRKLVKRRPSETTRQDRLAALGCAVSATLLTWFVMHLLLESPGWLADLIVACCAALKMPRSEALWVPMLVA